jgi:hypothetical protein
MGSPAWTKEWSEAGSAVETIRLSPPYDNWWQWVSRSYLNVLGIVCGLELPVLNVVIVPHSTCI